MAVQGLYASSYTLPQNNGYVNVKTAHLGWGYDIALSKLNEMVGFPDQVQWEVLEQQESSEGNLRVSLIPIISGLKMEGNMMMLHFKKGILSAVNGNVGLITSNRSTIPSISSEVALSKVANNYAMNFNQQNTSNELVFRNIKGENFLTWKVEIKGISKKEMQFKHIIAYVDASNGEVLHSYNNIHHYNTTADLSSYYYGNVSIDMMQNSEGLYVLEDTIRNIKVSNVGGQMFDNYGMTVDAFFPDRRAISSETLSFGPHNTVVEVMVQQLPQDLLLGYGYNNNELIIPAMVIVEVDGNNTDTIGRVIFDILGPITLPISTQEIYVNLDEEKEYQIGFQKLNINAYNLDISVIDGHFVDMVGTTQGLNTVQPNPEISYSYQIDKTANLGVDALYTIQTAHDFYSEQFGRDGVDDQGGLVEVLVDGVYSLYLTQMNAFAFTQQKMIAFGTGDRFFMDPLVTLDVMAHEYQHIVTDFNGRGGLEYAQEPGALNEAWSDIFAKAVEFKKHPEIATWQIGEELSVIPGGYMRSMSEPKGVGNTMLVSPPQPDTYLGQHWFNTNSQQDNGGVHYNSGVANKWFYLLVEGGTGVNDHSKSYEVQGIGLDKAIEVAYRALMERFTPYTNYVEAADLTWSVAKELYGEDSEEAKAVYDAWYAVGLFDGGINVNELVSDLLEWSVYPNPTSGIFKIKHSSKNVLDMAIFNISGKEIYRGSLPNGVTEINLEGVSAGLYFLEVNDNGQKTVEKLVVK